MKISFILLDETVLPHNRFGSLPETWQMTELLLLKTFQDAISLIESGEAVVEIKRGTE
jgi:hypothetical protein